MTRALNTVLKDINDGESMTVDLEEKAQAATSEAERLDTEAMDLLIKDPAAAEDIAAKVYAQKRLAQAYADKLGEYRSVTIPQLRREALEAEAVELLKKADKLQIEADQHDEKSRQLLAPVEKHDGVTYELNPARSSQKQRTQAGELRWQAALNRHWLAVGRHATSQDEVRRNVPGGDELGPLVLTFDRELHQYRTKLLDKTSAKLRRETVNA